MIKPLTALALMGLFTVAASASAPVHIALKPTATVSADSDGFFTLGSVAALSGGDPAEREKFCHVRVGRAPLPDQTRQVTPGDVLLKLRQAGFHPEDDAVLEGARTIAVTLTAAGRGPEQSILVNSGTPAVPDSARSSAAPSLLPPVLVHRGDPLTIVIHDGDMMISAKGVARDPGAAGDTIHVHRDGLMADLNVTVVDAQTVQLEM